MAKALPLQTMDSLAGVDARLQAIDKLEELVNEVVQEKRRRRSNIALKRAIRTWRKGDIVKAGQWALKATEADPENSKAFHVLAMALERMGHLHKALVTYERAFQLDPEDPELLINLGLTAWNLKLTEGAARMFQLYIAACPESPLGYNNLGSIQSDMGTPDVAIETLRAALYRMPNEAILWNSLATVLAEEGRADESLIFYREAARLEPGFARAYHNLGYAYQHLSELDNALASYDKALELVVDPAERIETRHSRSICLIGLGKLEEGFREYEIRNNERFRCYFHHIIDAPRWHGEDVRGKALRLVPFASKENKPDFWAPMGSALQYYRKSVADFPRKPILVPDSVRVAEYKKQMAMLPGKKVGICWRSMLMSGKRAKYFSPIDAWGKILQTPGITFVNLQYGDSAPDIARAKEKFGVRIHQVEGLDLKDDIDGTAALALALDLVLSAPTAAAHTAASVGAKVWYLAVGLGWPQLGTAEYPWHADTRVFWPTKFGDWDAVMPHFSSELTAFAAE